MEELKDKILSWIEQTLVKSNDFFLPLKKLRKNLVTGLTVPVPSLEEMAGWLEEDERFDLLPEPEDLGFLPSGPAEEMERLGFFDGPRVGLRSRRPTPARSPAGRGTGHPASGSHPARVCLRED